MGGGYSLSGPWEAGKPLPDPKEAGKPLPDPKEAGIPRLKQGGGYSPFKAGGGYTPPGYMPDIHHLVYTTRTPLGRYTPPTHARYTHCWYTI